MAKRPHQHPAGRLVHLGLKSDLWQSCLELELRVPDVHLGLKSDLWQSDRYATIERALVHLGLKSDLWQSVVRVALR